MFNSLIGKSGFVHAIRTKKKNCFASLFFVEEQE